MIDIEEAREILITLGANADKRLKFSERHALAKYLELRDELEQQLAELREALRKIEKIAAVVPLDKAILEIAREALLKQGGEG